MTAPNAHLEITSPEAPPHWALLERNLLASQSRACEAFFAHYFDERGYLMCVPRWGGNDGPDDAAENQLNWTILHALGAPDNIMTMFKKGWDGHLRQYTEAKTVDVPFARDGMYFKEFPVMFDWFHHGEGLSAFTLQGLSDPHDRHFRQRCRRYAGMYMGEEPLADNYDPEHKIIRSMFNGSRGPLLRKATALDWAGDPIEISGRFKPGHGERTYEEMLQHFEDYTDVVGDHPLNLGATTLGFNAYLLDGEEKYRKWMLEYIDAWAERTAANNGIIPSNIGLDGSIGGECDGKWYGGCYGWAFTVTVPQTGELAHRPSYGRIHYGFANALLLTGDQSYVDVWRGVMDKVNENAREIDGKMQYPHMHGDQGWYEFRPNPFAVGALETYYWSMNKQDRERVPQNDWLAYLDGDNPDYPVQALGRDLERLRGKVEELENDDTSPDGRMSDDMNGTNPATTDALIQLMLGGLPTGRTGFPLHCRLRYFDPARQRAGLPEDVAALVESMSADEVRVHLVNTSPLQHRTVIVQGGAYGEHQLVSVSQDGQTAPVDNAHFAVHLAPGCGGHLTIAMQRYANQPTFTFPWERG